MFKTNTTAKRVMSNNLNNSPLRQSHCHKLHSSSQTLNKFHLARGEEGVKMTEAVKATDDVIVHKKFSKPSRSMPN
jgi:hypothetical protein